MFDHQLRVAKDRQAQLRAEAQRQATPRSIRRIASSASTVRLALPGMDVASGSVLPATH